jgi:TonB family protein
LAVAGGGAGAWVAFMSTSKFALSLTTAVVLGGAGIVALQEHSRNLEARELADLNLQNGQMASIVGENQRLVADARRVTSLEGDSANLGPLRAQVRELEAKAAAQLEKKLTGRANPAQAMKPADAASAFDITKLDQRPVAVSQARPEYPPEKRQAGVSGQVLVDFIVGGDGHVYNARAVDSSEPGFEDSAVQAVSQWVFKPGQLAGQAVNTHMQVPIVYALNDSAPTTGTWF